MRACQRVEVITWSGGEADAHGNTVDAYAEPVPRYVYGWAPTSSTEPKTVGPNRVVVDLEVFSPFTLQPKDRVVVHGRTYEVEGECEDWNHGPFGHRPGFVVNLRRVDG